MIMKPVTWPKILFEKKRIETIINSMHDAIIGLDEKMFIIFANKVACNLIGLPEDKLTAQYAPQRCTGKRSVTQYVAERSA